MARAPAGREGVRLLRRDEVETGDGNPRPGGEVFDVRHEVGGLARLERPRSAHAERETVGEPEHGQVEPDGDHEEDGDPARASDQAADGDEERREPGEQDPGAHTRCHEVFRVLSG